MNAAEFKVLLLPSKNLDQLVIQELQNKNVTKLIRNLALFVFYRLRQGR